MFVSNEQSNEVTLLDGATGRIEAHLGTGPRPRGMAFSPDRHTFYVAASNANRIEPWDVRTRRLLRTYGSGTDPERFAISPDGSTAYIANEDHSGVSFLASNVEMVATSRPYYRSTYVLVTRQSANLKGLTLDDPRLKRLRIGVQMVGNDASNTPPAHALAGRGIIANVRGYMLYGDYRAPNPRSEIVRAVERGDIDAALVWGPLLIGRCSALADE